MNSEMPGKLKPALICGSALGFVSAIPYLGCCLNLLCCSVAVGGGFLATFLYLRKAPPTPETPYGDGAVLGLIAGPVGAVVWLIVNIPLTLLSTRLGLEMDPEMIEDWLERFNVPQESIDQIVQTMQNVSQDPANLLAQLIVPFFIVLVAFTIFAIVGGLIGAAVFHKKSASTVSQFEPPPPPAA